MGYCYTQIPTGVRQGGYHNDSLRYYSLYNLNTDTVHAQHMYPPLTWQPIFPFQTNSAFNIDLKTGVAIFNRNFVNNVGKKLHFTVDSFYLTRVSRADSLELKYKVGSFVFRNILVGCQSWPDDYYVVCYKNENNNDLMFTYNDYRIGNIDHIDLYTKDSINYLAQDKTFIEELVGKNYRYVGGNTYDLGHVEFNVTVPANGDSSCIKLSTPVQKNN